MCWRWASHPPSLNSRSNLPLACMYRSTQSLSILLEGATAVHVLAVLALLEHTRPALAVAGHLLALCTRSASPHASRGRSAPQSRRCGPACACERPRTLVLSKPEKPSSLAIASSSDMSPSSSSSSASGRAGGGPGGSAVHPSTQRRQSQHASAKRGRKWGYMAHRNVRGRLSEADGPGGGGGGTAADPSLSMHGIATRGRLDTRRGTG